MKILLSSGILCDLIRAVTRTYLQGGQAEARGAKPIVKIFRCVYSIKNILKTLLKIIKI